ncbi:MAG: 16S rRNA (cytidine(1402)-2'-O)-methyltransferase [Acidobacteriota bacterium]
MSLYIVPVPIGNLKDITLRAIEVLENVDFIIAEDTRYSLKLLNHLKIKKKIVSYYKPKEREKVKKIIELLNKSSGALITDSGTPLISDPGSVLLEESIKNGIHIESLPGPTAFVPALTSSGISPEKFLFLGFSPRKTGQLETWLHQLEELEYTLIFYESPRRVESFLNSAFKIFGNRKFSISKELSKKNERTIRGGLEDWKKLLEHVKLLGEFVIIIEGNMDKNKKKTPEIESMDDIYKYFLQNYNISKNSLKKKLMRKR